MSKSRRCTIDLVGPDGRTVLANSTLDELRLKYGDAEVMSYSQWKTFLYEDMISPMADVSSQDAYDSAQTQLPPAHYHDGGAFQYYVAGEPLHSDIHAIYARLDGQYFFLHDRLTVPAEQVLLKIQLRIATETIARLEALNDTLSTPRRVLVVVKEGCPAYVSDKGIDVVMFEHEFHDSSPDLCPLPPANFADLARRIGVSHD